MNIDIIPVDIVCKIFDFLSLKELSENVVLTCKKFAKICKENNRLKKKVWMWLLWGEREVPPQIRSKTIYVGNIARGVKEEEILQIVPNQDCVTSIRIVSEKHKIHSPAYAYINFISVEEAEKMIPLTFTEIHGKRIVCNFKQVETSKQNVCNVGNIYIDKIGERTPKMEEEMLAKLLSFGEVLSLRIELKRAFIQYAKKEAAIECVLKMDESMLGNKKIEVRPFVSKERRKSSKKVFLRNLSKKTTKEKLVAFFSKFGKLLECKIVEDKKKEEKTAVLEFPAEVAEKILENMSSVNLDGNLVLISDTKESTKKASYNFREYFYSGLQCNIYVNNLHEKISENDLYYVFSNFGEIVSLKIPTDEQKRSKGFAYICYRDPKHAIAAIENMNNKVLPPGKKRINVTIWQPREARFTQLFQQYHQPYPRSMENYPQELPVYPNEPYMDVHNFMPPNDPSALEQQNFEYMLYPPHAYFPQPMHPMVPGGMVPFPNYYYPAQQEDTFVPPPSQTPPHFVPPQERKHSPFSNLNLKQDTE